MRKENAKSSGETGPAEPAPDQSFYRRWSRRKQRARRGQAEDAPAEAADSEKPPGPGAAGEQQPERVLTDDDMPPIESLNENSDYSGFMSPGVSESLRRLALRKMFLSSKYNFTDGLDDYADDFTSFAPLGDIITADMRHQIEMKAEQAKQKLEEEARAAIDDTPAGEDQGNSGVPAQADGDGAGTIGENPETPSREGLESHASADPPSPEDEGPRRG